MNISLCLIITLCAVGPGPSESIEATNENDLFCDDGICTRISDEPIPTISYGEDKHTMCEEWAFSGECEANPKYMLSSCAKSCVTYSAQKECLDEEDRNKCRSLAEMGMCLLHRDDMENVCEETCMFCIGEDHVLRAEGVSEDEIVRRHAYASMIIGEHQVNIGRDKVERYNNRAQIQAMDRYSKQNVTEPSFTPEARSLCTNTKKECSYYASKGLCKSKPVFMLSNCPLACMMCEEIEKFHQCVGTRHPFNNPLFVPRDTFDYVVSADEIGLSTINSLFKSLSDNFEKVQFVTKPWDDEEGSPEKNDPYIALVENFLSPEECQELISLAKEEGEGWKVSPVHRSDHFNGMHGHKIPIRSSLSFECNESETKSCTAISSSLVEKVSQRINKPLRHFEPVELIHYPPGGFYTLHEEFKSNDEWKPAGPRVLSIFVVLSEAVGGSFGFPSVDALLVKPKIGSMLIWSNLDDSMNYDSNLRHEIMPVRSGDLYMLSTHVHLFDYLDSLDQGCA